MNSSNSLTTVKPELAHDEEFDRLQRTTPFRNEKFARWTNSLAGVVGCGHLGSRVAPEIVRSGASGVLIDPQIGETVNRGTQAIRVGIPKAESVAADCNEIRPGRARGIVADIRHVGIAVLKRLDVLFDCTDDPTLAVPLTEISNGLGIPLLRLALDGSGKREMGRVLCSHGGAGHVCQICHYDASDLWRHAPRTPCPGQTADTAAATLAGGGIGMAVAGLGVLQAQRLVTGNDHDLVIDREVILDWSNFQVFPARLQRSKKCFSGHVRWRLTELSRSAEETTLGNLFTESRERLGTDAIVLEAYGHAFCTLATCSCGAAREQVGTIWAEPPHCSRCNVPMLWRRELQLSRVNERDILLLGIDRTPLVELGLPSEGAMFVARTRGKSPIRFLLR